MFIYLEIRLVFVIHLIYIPPEIILLIWKRHHGRWRAKKLGLTLKKELSIFEKGGNCYTCCDTEPRFLRSHPKDRPIESYWVLLSPIDSYWVLLTPIESYWLLLTPIESYWVSFTQSNAYWGHVLARIPTIFIEKHREINLKMIWTFILFLSGRLQQMVIQYVKYNRTFKK